MKVSVENYSNNSLCYVNICYNKTLTGECSELLHCNFRWSIIPHHLSNNNTLSNDTTIVPTSLPADEEGSEGTDEEESDGNIPSSMIEPCAPNTWLWVVDSSEEGEAHFLVGKNMINDVSIVHCYS